MLTYDFNIAEAREGVCRVHGDTTLMNCITMMLTYDFNIAEAREGVCKVHQSTHLGALGAT
jgi:hypothetical protein